MPHFKRRKPKSSRAGCLLCHAHKHNRLKGMSAHQTRQEQLARVDEREQRSEACL